MKAETGKREKRVPIMLSEEELTMIDNWRFANRIATRSEAIRQLCKHAIEWRAALDLLEGVPAIDVANDYLTLMRRKGGGT